MTVAEVRWATVWEQEARTAIETAEVVESAVMGGQSDGTASAVGR